MELLTDTSTLYGYIRVSSQTQSENSSLESQKNELCAKGVPKKNIYKEIASATDKIENRPVFHNLIENVLKDGDTLVVSKIDRCSRDTLSFLKLQDKLSKQGVNFISLDLPYSSDMAVNKLITTHLAAIATFENERRRDRQRQGIEAAKRAGKYKGRKSVITKQLIAEVKDLKENKRLPVTKISRVIQKSPSTIYKILKNELGYVSNRLVKVEEMHESESK